MKTSVLYAAGAVLLAALGLAAEAQADQATTGPSIMVNRSGTFKLVGIVNKVTKFTGPLWATVSVRHTSNLPNGGSFDETAGAYVKFNGKLGRFVVIIPYLWRGADPTQTIMYQVGISTVGCLSLDLGLPCERNVGYSPTQGIPLPANNGTQIVRVVEMTE